MAKETVRLRLDELTLDPRLQMRPELREETLERYTLLVDDLPPIRAVHDGKKAYVADGHYRYLAHQRAGLEDIDCEITKGTFEDALMVAAKANYAHGEPRGKDGTRNAVLALARWNDEQKKGWTQGNIARLAGVTQQYVSRLLAEEAHNLVVSADAEGSKSAEGDSPDPPAAASTSGTASRGGKKSGGGVGKGRSRTSAGASQKTDTAAQPPSQPSPAPPDGDDYQTDDDADATPVAPDEGEAEASHAGRNGAAGGALGDADPRKGLAAIGVLARVLDALGLYERHRLPLEAVLADLNTAKAELTA